jgi:hypothetical protein
MADQSDFHPGLIAKIEEKLPVLPEELLLGLSIGDRLIMALEGWHIMQGIIQDQQKKIDGAVKDLEYTLNLLNVAESNLGREHAELKNIIGIWLQYYKDLTKKIQDIENNV